MTPDDGATTEQPPAPAQRGPRVAFIPGPQLERPLDRLDLSNQADRERYGVVTTTVDIALLKAASHIGGRQGLLMAQLAIEALIEHKRKALGSEFAFDYADAEELLDKEQVRVWLVPVAAGGGELRVAVAVQTPPDRRNLPVCANPERARQALLAGLRSVPVRGLPGETDKRLRIVPDGADPAPADTGTDSNNPPTTAQGLVALIRESRLSPVFLFDNEPCTLVAFETECRVLGLAVDRADCGDC